MEEEKPSCAGGRCRAGGSHPQPRDGRRTASSEKDTGMALNPVNPSLRAGRHCRSSCLRQAGAGGWGWVPREARSGQAEPQAQSPALHEPILGRGTGKHSRGRAS